MKPPFRKSNLLPSAAQLRQVSVDPSYRRELRFGTCRAGWLRCSAAVKAALKPMVVRELPFRFGMNVFRMLIYGFLFLLVFTSCDMAGSPAGAQVAELTTPTIGADCSRSTQEAAICAAEPLTAEDSPAAQAVPELNVSPAGPLALPPTPGPLSPTPALNSASSGAETPASPTPLSPIPLTPTPLPPTPCPPDLCAYASQLMLMRPISPPGKDTIDVSYRFGTTQGGQRDPHHGVEFLNPMGTPVLAAADGEVVVAGDDRQIFYGPYSYFYGNLIVLEHRLPGLSQPLYTLYGHLSRYSVKVGESVQVGQEIGQVGMSGVATGSHLHFEVRLGENTYENSSNPELWLAPRLDGNGQPMGALAGWIRDSHGNPLEVETIVLEHLTSADGPSDFSLYLKTYEEKTLIGLPPFEESFAAGDLPAGWYRISFVQNGMQSRLLQILPGQLMVVTFRLGG